MGGIFFIAAKEPGNFTFFMSVKYFLFDIGFILITLQNVDGHVRSRSRVRMN